MKSGLKKYLYLISNILVCVLIFIGLFFYSKNVFPEKSLYTCLCDSAFVCSIVFLCWTGLAFVASKGVFDFISFAFKKMVEAVKDPKHKNQSSMSYAEYVSEKSDSNKSKLIVPLIIGAIMMLFAIIFLTRIK